MLMTHTVHLHKHDMSTILLHCLITSMIYSLYVDPLTPRSDLHTISPFNSFVLHYTAHRWWEYEWMNECVFIYRTYHIAVSRRFTILIEWDRTSACKGASGCRYQSIFDLTHPPSPCMKCTMKQQIDHHTGNYAPYSFRQVCGFFNVPCWPCNTEDAGDGAYGL